LASKSQAGSSNGSARSKEDRLHGGEGSGPADSWAQCGLLGSLRAADGPPHEEVLSNPAVDATGRLAWMLVIARYTGRRLNAICQLRGSDVFLSQEAVRRAVASGGQDERQADYMPHGALRWRAEHDKLGYEDIAPIPPSVRTALEGYLRARQCIGEAPLFPARNHPDRALTKMDASNALRRAEEQAELVKLERGAWHPYRRLWAVERKHLPDVDVARAGGWRDLATMKRSYQQADAATVLKVVENAPSGHIADTRTTKVAQAQ
jgi:integrase